MLVAVPVGASPAGGGCPDATVVIPGCCGQSRIDPDAGTALTHATSHISNPNAGTREHIHADLANWSDGGIRSVSDEFKRSAQTPGVGSANSRKEHSFIDIKGL